MARPFPICGVQIYPGETREVELLVGELSTTSPVAIPVRVVRGWEDGPRLFVTAAVHGDEINGTEIIRELVYDVNLSTLKGTLVCVPVVNLFGFLNHSRYLPDRRDLNRSFPGSPAGPLAHRLAWRVFHEIIRRCHFGIDLHTASEKKMNVPHVRADLGDKKTRKLALAFGTEVVLHSEAGKGSLRGAAQARRIPVLTYEGGEPLRFERHVVERGLEGILNVMSALGMIDRPRSRPLFQVVARKATWVRADRGGILDLRARPGDLVRQGEEIGIKSNPFGRERHPLVAPFTGLVVGATTLPTVNPGDAVVHIVKLARSLPKIEAVLHGRSLLDLHYDEGRREPHEEGDMNVKRVERVAIAVPDLDAARSFFEAVLGATFQAIEDVADQGFRYQPFTVAGFTLELLCPYRDDSVIARFLREKGPGVHHVSFEVEDLDQAIAALAADGVSVVHRIEYPEGVLFEGFRWREAFVHPRSAFGLLMHICEKRRPA